MVKVEDFSKFTGGWGMSSYSMFLAIKHSLYESKLNILEFGSGDGTSHLVNYLNSKDIKFNYVSVENDKNYAKTPNVNYIYKTYDVNSIDALDLNLNDVFDLVIVDGPHGVGRAKWYSKFKNNIKEGTIIIVDDYHHYKEFSEQLDANFEYININTFNQNNKWQIINDGIDPTDLENKYCNMDKSYKIVKVIKSK
jgi:predicted O-methyltransferase YrrM